MKEKENKNKSNLDRKVQLGLRLKEHDLLELRTRARQNGLSPQAIITILVRMYLKNEINIKI